MSGTNYKGRTFYDRKRNVTGNLFGYAGYENGYTGYENGYAGYKTDIRDLKSRVSSIEMTLENETNRNIRIIAEGHADLSRKLDEALKVESEKELLLVRTNIMENDIRKIKDKLEIA